MDYGKGLRLFIRSPYTLNGRMSIVSAAMGPDYFSILGPDDFSGLKIWTRCPFSQYFFMWTYWPKKWAEGPAGPFFNISGPNVQMNGHYVHLFSLVLVSSLFTCWIQIQCMYFQFSVVPSISQFNIPICVIAKNWLLSISRILYKYFA